MEEEVKGYNGARPQEGKALMGELPGNTGQVGGDRASRKAGLYRHPGNGAEVITVHDPLLGDGQSRAAERAGFVFVRDVDPSEIKELGAPSENYAAQPARAVEAQDAYNKGVQARLDALEAENARLRSERESGNPVPGTEPVKGAEATKEAAAERTEVYTGVKVDPATGDVQAPAEPAGDSNTEADNQHNDETGYKDLQAQAKELGVSAKGSKEELTQRIADAKAEKEDK